MKENFESSPLGEVNCSKCFKTIITEGGWLKCDFPACKSDLCNLCNLGAPKTQVYGPVSAYNTNSDSKLRDAVNPFLIAEAGLVSQIDTTIKGQVKSEE